MPAPSTEAVALILVAAATAIAAVLYLLHRQRRRVVALRGELRRATARARISDVLLSGEKDRLGAALPAVGLLADGVTAIYPVTSPARPSRLLVAAPPDRTEPSMRAAAALLAAVSVSTAEVPEFERAVRTGLPQRGRDIGALLRRGATSLPYAARDKLYERLTPTPFLVVPISRQGGQVGGLLLALGEKEELEGKVGDLTGVTSRLSVLLLPARKGPARAPVQTTRARSEHRSHPATPEDADAVLWLDDAGEVASCEMLQSDWTVAPPRSLHELFGVVAGERLLERASVERPVTLGLARFGDEILAEVSLLRLADGDANTWGYVAFLRRLGAAMDQDAGDASPSSRSASLLR